jgi:hypothetical protein
MLIFYVSFRFLVYRFVLCRFACRVRASLRKTACFRSGVKKGKALFELGQLTRMPAEPEWDIRPF